MWFPLVFSFRQSIQMLPISSTSKLGVSELADGQAGVPVIRRERFLLLWKKTSISVWSQEATSAVSPMWPEDFQSKFHLQLLVGGLEHFINMCPFSWECHHPSPDEISHIFFQRGRHTTNQTKVWKKPAERCRFKWFQDGTSIGGQATWVLFFGYLSMIKYGYFTMVK